MPFGPRKSGMPDSVEMPAPVRATTRRASRNHPAISPSWLSSTLLTRPALHEQRIREHPFDPTLVPVECPTEAVTHLGERLGRDDEPDSGHGIVTTVAS